MSLSTQKLPKIEDMENKTRTNLEMVKKEVTVFISDMSRQEAAEFLSELADWSYANSESMLIDDEPEMQNYEEEDDYEHR
mgnify:FL=1